jgi:hypothetical protein
MLLATVTLLVGCSQQPQTVETSNYSKVSVHAGNKPDGLDDFLQLAQPTILYSLNNSPYSDIQKYSPHTLLVRRVQNDTWGRLPDCMYCGLFDDNWEQQARASARYELTQKLIYVPQKGYLNYIKYSKLSQQDFMAPMNEPVLGNASGDYMYKARWLNAWFEEWLTIAHANGIKGSLYSFPTGEPPVEAVPYLTGSARIAAINGDIIDVHEYGIDGGLMDSEDPDKDDVNDNDNGAFGFVKFHDALPLDARPNFIVSEFSSGNGYNTGMSGQAWINDSIAYGQALRSYPYVIGATAFQLDRGAESNIPVGVLHNYATIASLANWSITQKHMLYMPLISNN